MYRTGPAKTRAFEVPLIIFGGLQKKSAAEKSPLFLDFLHVRQVRRQTWSSPQTPACLAESASCVRL